MALTYGFYNSVNQDRMYDAQDISRIFDGIIEDGVYAGIGEYLMVSSGGGMNVSIGTGRAWFNHTWSYNDGAVLETIGVAHALMDRIDTVYLEINFDIDERRNSFGIAQGTPATNPVPPTLENTATVRQYPLADALVRATVGSLTNGDFTNRVGTEDCPFVTGAVQFVTTSDLLVQWEAQWEVWFEAIQDQLTEEAETNLQDQIWDIVGDINAPLTTLLELFSHTHATSSPGNRIPTDGVENGAITLAKMAANSIDSSKVVNGSLTANDIATSLAGNGLGGGAGLALFARTDNQTIEISNDTLRVKANSIGSDQIANHHMADYIPSTVMQAYGGAIKHEGYDNLGGFIQVDDTDPATLAIAQVTIPQDLPFNSGSGYWEIYVKIWWEALGYGTPAWKVGYKRIGEGTGFQYSYAVGTSAWLPDPVWYGDTVGPLYLGDPLDWYHGLILNISRDVASPDDVNPQPSRIYGISVYREAIT